MSFRRTLAILCTMKNMVVAIVAIVAIAGIAITTVSIPTDYA